MIQFLLNAPRLTKRLITLTYDAFMIPVAIYAALALRTGIFIPQISEETLYAVAATTIISLIVFTKTGLYRAVIRYMATKAFGTLAIGISISALVLATSTFILQAQIPRSSIIIYWFTAFTLLGLPRLFIRNIVSQLSATTKEAVIIYGAGSQGIALMNALSNSENYRPIAFIDDNRKKQGSVIKGLKVHPSSNIQILNEQFNISKILLALGNASSSKRKRLIENITDFNLEILTTPAVQDIISGKAQIEEVKEVEIEDLLGRDCVIPNLELLSNDIKNKIVLITGAGGSIGSELCRQIIKQAPTKIILLELNEFSLYSIEQELMAYCSNYNECQTEIVSILGSVQKQNRLETIFKTFKVQTIYHAAAYKHVPMVEHNVVEGVRNNIFGTWYCAEAAISAGVERFVLISTDKAVRPSNVMGASKRLAELVLQALTKRQSDTLFCMVRFGNVLGSSGSVVPLFRKQIKSGGPITVTHPDITRYFMTIPEASQLVIQAGAMAKGGDVFVLDMGDPIKITSLAKKMILLSGLTEKKDSEPSGDIEIKFTGLRPGEKLYEELLIGKNVEGSEHPRIMTANEIHLTWPETHNLLNKLDKACHDFKVDDVLRLLLEAPAAFNNQADIPDWVFNQTQKNSVK
jgi:FlaA1/EpsC-like NDP-sugar epimerase